MDKDTRNRIVKPLAVCTQALDGLKEQCLELIAAGKKVLVQ